MRRIHVLSECWQRQAHCCSLRCHFTYAKKRKIRTDNPCQGLEKPKDIKRTRRLSDAEYHQLSAALAKADSPFANVVMMLAITGWRSSEVKNLRWTELDLDRKVATLGATKTGVSIRPLSAPAIDLIRQRPQTSQFVFPYVREKPIYNITPHWYRLKMPSDVTPHVLRHSFASLAADLGCVLSWNRDPAMEWAPWGGQEFRRLI